MRKNVVAVMAITAVLVLGVVGVAMGAIAGVKYFKTTLTPSSGIKSGTVLTAKATGALHSTAYFCVIAAYPKNGKGGSASDNATLKRVMSNSKGAVTCKVTFKPFSAKDGEGHTRHCPSTAADTTAGFACGVALADAATIGGLSESVASFTAK